MKKKLLFMVIAGICVSNMIFASSGQPIFYESFSKMNWEYIVDNGAHRIEGRFDEFFDNEGWTGDNMMYGYQRTTEEELFTEFNEIAFPRFGNTRTDSYIITPTLDLTGGVLVRFKVKSFIRNTGGEPTIENPNMKVEYAPDGTNFTDFFAVDDMDGVFTEKQFEIPAHLATANAKIKFNRHTFEVHNRFFISDIIVEKISTSVQSILPDYINIHSVAGGIMINTQIPERVQIFSIVGEKIKDISLQGGEHITYLHQGVYIVKASNYAAKVIVR